MLINSVHAPRQLNTNAMKEKQAAFGSQEEQNLEQRRAEVEANKADFNKALERKRIEQRDKDIERWSNGGDVDYFVKAKGKE